MLIMNDIDINKYKNEFIYKLLKKSKICYRNLNKETILNIIKCNEKENKNIISKTNDNNKYDKKLFMKGKNCYKRKMEFVSRKRNRNVKESNINNLLRKDNEYEYSEPFNDKTNFQQPMICNNIQFKISVNNHDITFDCNIIKLIPIQKKKKIFIPINLNQY